MAVKTFTSEILTSSDTNTYLANSGTQYITSVTVGSAVASVTVSSAFSSTWDAYEIVYTSGVSSTTQELYLQMTGITGGNYFSAGAYNTSGSGTYNGIGVSSGTSWRIGSCTTTSYGLTITVHNPNLVKNTYYRSNFASDYSSGWIGGVINTTTSTTGFTISTGAGTLTGGTITVYGYRKA